MRVINDKSGSQVESITEYDIATATAITEGQVVMIALDKVTSAAADSTTAMLGIAKEAHTGAADALNPRSNGTKILVSDSPHAVFECPAPQVAATSGSTTNFTATTIVGTYGTDAFKGGNLKLISKVAGSTNTDAIGTIYPITASHTSSGAFTIASIAGAITAGDVMAIFPPNGFQLGNLDATFQKLVLTGSAAIPIVVIGKDTARNTIKFQAALHANANKKA